MELASVQESETIKRCPVGVQHVAKGFRYHLDCKEGHPAMEEVSRVRQAAPSLVLVHYGSSYVPFQITAYDQSSGVFYRLFTDVNASRDCRVTVLDDFAYVCRVVDFGGGTLMSSLFRFDPRHLLCQELRPMRRLRIDCALVAFCQTLLVFGGSTEQFAILDSVEGYNVIRNSWEDLLPLPVPTHSLAAIVSGERVYLSGGVSGQDRQATNSFVSYHPSARRYEAHPGMFYARRLHDMVALDDRIFVVGGLPRQGVPLHGHIPIESFSMLTNQWTMLSSTLSGRSVGHYINFVGQMLSLGHEHHSATEDEIWRYAVDIDDWSKYTKAPQRLSLTSAIVVVMHVNFHDEKVSKNFIKDK
jgi:kelch-like protein 26